MNKKILATVFFLSSCKASQLAATAPALDLEACSVPTSTLVNATNTQWDCLPSNQSIYAQAYIFKATGEACSAVYDLDGNMVSTSCGHTWTRDSCTTITDVKSDYITTLGDITPIANGFSVNLNVKNSVEDLGTQAYSCTLSTF